MYSLIPAIHTLKKARTKYRKNITRKKNQIETFYAGGLVIKRLQAEIVLLEEAVSSCTAAIHILEVS